MPSARRVHFLPKLTSHLTFEVGGVHTISPEGVQAVWELLIIWRIW
jgi:hypothetical protein